MPGYNIFLGLGIIAGVITLQAEPPIIGRTLIFYVCGLTGPLDHLLITTPRLWRGSLWLARSASIL